MKRNYILILLFFSFTISQSQTFNDGVFEYIVTDATNNYVSLNKYNDTCVTGNITIDNTIINSSITYTITSIGEEAFRDCTGLTNITLPNSLTSIEAIAFFNCQALTSITIPDSVTSIGFGAFGFCSSLINIALPNSLSSIENNVFRNCTSLTSITIPDSVTSIGLGAFSESGLTSITIPEGVTSIEDLTFQNCSSLASISLPNSLTSIEYAAFEACTSLASITIPNSVTSIGLGAFIFSGLNSINLPNSLISIDLIAFYGCDNLASITIPESVTSIGDDAFALCTGITNVTVNWSTPLVINSSVFSDVTLGNITLTVPLGTESVYQSTAVWQDFGSIVLGTSNPDLEDALNIYPNPVKDVLNITLNQGIELKQINIYNILSQYLYSVNTSKLDFSNLTSGIYFVEVVTNQGKISKKIIVE